jgi:hypothetical protein
MTGTSSRQPGGSPVTSYEEIIYEVDDRQGWEGICWPARAMRPAWTGVKPQAWK